MSGRLKVVSTCVNKLSTIYGQPVQQIVTYNVVLEKVEKRKRKWCMCTFQMSMVMSYWLDKNDDTGEMAAPMAILLLVCTNPAQRRL